jgi:hypothetical protein
MGKRANSAPTSMIRGSLIPRGRSSSNGRRRQTTTGGCRVNSRLRTHFSAMPSQIRRAMVRADLRFAALRGDSRFEDLTRPR